MREIVSEAGSGGRFTWLKVSAVVIAVIVLSSQFLLLFNVARQKLNREENTSQKHGRRSSLFDDDNVER